MPWTANQPDLSCAFGCAGIDRLLCCSTDTAGDVVDSACGVVDRSVVKRDVLIIHNSPTYGGAGYTNLGYATASMHPSASYVAAHEFGHSTFKLGDEYPGSSDDSAPNCEVAGCDTWADIVALNLAEPGSSCTSGKCQSSAYYSSGPSLMESLSEPFGVVNERFTCCTYLALPGVSHEQIPPYCRRFMAVGTVFASPFPALPDFPALGVGTSRSSVMTAASGPTRTTSNSCRPNTTTATAALLPPISFTLARAIMGQQSGPKCRNGSMRYFIYAILRGGGTERHAA